MRWQMLVAGVSLVAAVAGTGCSSGSKPEAQPSAHETSDSPVATDSARQLTPLEVCLQRCIVRAGPHVLPLDTILPGLRFSLSDGWGATQNDETEIHFVPPNHPDDAVFLWRDIRAVNSTGPDPGTRFLRDVGPSPSALVCWITRNPDFDVIDPPRRLTLGRGIKATGLTVQVSRTARFGDSGCPDNPRCAAFFEGKSWSADLVYAIGGDETARMLFATVPFSGRSSTLVITLDAKNPKDLLELQRAVSPFLDSLRLPTT
jgi:hypothetical protein